MNRSQKLEIAEELAYLGELIVKQVESNPTERRASNSSQLKVSFIRAGMEDRMQLVRDLSGGSAAFNHALLRLDSCSSRLKAIEASVTTAEVGL